jgi:hypothetical protein
MALCVFEKEKEKEKEKLRCLGFAAGVCEGIFHFRAGKSV